MLRGHPNIVNLTDEAILIRTDGSHEVFILMEYCDGGCIIDLMNRRLRERLSEATVLKIFVDVCEAVAYMHSFDPPLIHRDLKVENVLQQGGGGITGESGGAGKFVVCDFGSTSTPAITQPTTHGEIRALEKDLNRHTTLQYRAPEMVDPYLRRPVDQKSGAFRSWKKIHNDEPGGFTESDPIDRRLGPRCPTLQALLLCHSFRRS